MLNICDLHATIQDQVVLKGLNIEVKPGSIHAIMGPNGSGKSTFSKVLAGNPDYEVTQGTVSYCEKDLLELPTEERAREGLFVGFQYPVEVPGVNNMYFLRSACNTIRKYRKQPEIDAVSFLTLAKEKLKLLGMSEELIYRSLNENFSGGEKKRNEILQLLLLEPKLALLDEIDSGLDIDALQYIAKGIHEFHSEHTAVILITHYQRILSYVVPDCVHIMVDGRIIETGDKTLALEVEKHGYATRGLVA